jgi:hypothetical protein
LADALRTLATTDDTVDAVAKAHGVLPQKLQDKLHAVYKHLGLVNNQEKKKTPRFQLRDLVDRHKVAEAIATVASRRRGRPAKPRDEVVATRRARERQQYTDDVDVDRLQTAPVPTGTHDFLTEKRAIDILRDGIGIYKMQIKAFRPDLTGVDAIAINSARVGVGRGEAGGLDDFTKVDNALGASAVCWALCVGRDVSVHVSHLRCFSITEKCPQSCGTLQVLKVAAGDAGTGSNPSGRRPAH